MKKNIIIFLIVVVVIGISTMYYLNSPEDVLAKELNNDINEMMAQIEKGASNNLETQLSSNPYDYAKNNVYFEKIVDMGYPVVPLIEDYIVKSPDNGLREYLLAIAIEKVAKVDLKATGGTGWYTAKLFVKDWESHLANVPVKVKEILNSNKTDSEKASDIEKLGLPSTPYVMDYLNNSNGTHAEIEKSLVNLLKDSKITSEFKVDTTDFDTWSKENKAKLQNLRTYVESKHQ